MSGHPTVTRPDADDPVISLSADLPPRTEFRHRLSPMATDSVRVLSPSVDALRSLVHTPPGVHVSAFAQLDRLDELANHLILNPPESLLQDGAEGFMNTFIPEDLRSEPSKTIASQLDSDVSGGDRFMKEGAPSRLLNRRASFRDLIDRIERVVRTQYPVASSGPTPNPPVAVAIFAQRKDVVVVPLFFPIDTTTVVGDRFSISPLLTLFGPQHVTGLHITNQSASFVRQCGSFRSRTVLMRAVPGAFAMATPAQPASMTHVRPVVDWLRNIDRAVVQHLPYPQHPVVLTGDPSLCTAFRAINVHRYLIDGGDHFDLSSFRLHQHICTVAAAHHKEKRASGLREFYDARACSRHRTSVDPRGISTEASARRVQTLFVDERLFGAVPNGQTIGDGASSLVHRPSSNDMSRIDAAIVDTLSAGGTVHTVQGMQLPPGTHIAAIFRY